MIVRKQTRNNPRISVIMSVYNGEKYLRESIESILNQTFADFEFIIVNDGSTDDSLEMIKSYADSRIRVINNEENIGLTKSLNKGIKNAHGEYIARQDADDISLPNRFEEQIKFLEDNPEIAMIGTFGRIIYEGTQHQGYIVHPITDHEIRKHFIRINPFIHSSVIIRRDVFDSVGVYNERYPLDQDYELWIRIVKNFKVANLPKVLIVRKECKIPIWNKINKILKYGLPIRLKAVKDLSYPSYYYFYLVWPIIAEPLLLLYRKILTK